MKKEQLIKELDKYKRIASKRVSHELEYETLKEKHMKVKNYDIFYNLMGYLFLIIFIPVIIICILFYRMIMVWFLSYSEQQKYLVNGKFNPIEYYLRGFLKC